MMKTTTSSPTKFSGSLSAFTLIICCWSAVVLPTSHAFSTVAPSSHSNTFQKNLLVASPPPMLPYLLTTTKTPNAFQSHTKLFAARTGGEEDSRKEMRRRRREADNGGSSINFGLIGQNLANQALIGSTIWTGGPGYKILMNNAHFLNDGGIVLGLLGVIPLIALSRVIESSESYFASGLNLSTNMAVLRLFGPSTKPITALLASAAMAGLTGVVEEVTFRGQLIPFFANRFGDGDILTGALLSTFLFAVLHTNPASFLKGGEAALDNAVLLALQCVNGAIFASLYLGTGGNLAVPIIAHALYDFYIFYKTHLVDVAGQMEYAQREADMPNFSSRAIEEKWIRARGEDFVKGVKQSFYLMDTNRDGVLSRKELRIALFSYGINLSKVQSEKVTQFADVDGSGEIDLDEFMEFVGPTGSTGKAVRNTLIGQF